ncbi:hypothetical protein ED5_2427 [Enterobacter roggenkampii]|nr:hypothetical protein ED5_2427 [Enterobacter roggenkampii]
MPYAVHVDKIAGFDFLLGSEDNPNIAVFYDRSVNFSRYVIRLHSCGSELDILGTMLHTTDDD